MDQCLAAYRLDQKSSVRFYLRIFFDLMDITCVSSYLIYNMKHPSKLSLLDYKIVVTKNLIQHHQGRKRAVPMLRPSRGKNQPESIDNHEGRLLDYQMMRRRCAYCAMERKKKEHSSSVWLLNSITLSKGKTQNSKVKVSKSITFRRTYNIYFYIFAKTLWFFVWFLYVSTASLSFLYI